MSILDLGSVREVNINQEMRAAYLDYAMSVIVARALPDARDGLKPVHRRILYAMYDMGLRADSPYKKSARIVGEVLGKYHPHGDASVYEAMVRMAQDFSMRYVLVDGQGNFGSIDGDAAAAMRYTEARMANFGMELLADIDKDTVDFSDNFDGSLLEPDVLPCAVPNLLVNGSSGIAVGMSTSVPPHNLGEICDALIFMLENWERLDEIGVRDLMHYVKGPDFPTGGILFTKDAATGHDELELAYAQGRAKLTLRAKAHIENLGRGRSRVVITEIPYQINKSNLLERIVEVAQEGKIEGLVDLRDESDRQGLRIVVEVGRQADPKEVLTALFKYTPLQSTFSIIMLALVDGEPRTLSLKQALRVFIEHRLEVIRRRSEFDRARAQERAHILEGLLKAIDAIDQTIRIIRNSKDTEAARVSLVATFDLSERQAEAILEMPLRRLAALERQKLQTEWDEKRILIRDLTALLESPQLMRREIMRETNEIRKRYADNRKTLIAQSEATSVIESGTTLAESENIWVTLTLDELLSCSPDGEMPKVTASMKAPPLRVVQSNPSDTLYVFTQSGLCATIPASQLPKVEDPAEGLSIRRLSDLPPNDPLIGVVSMPPALENAYLFLVTRKGEVKRIRAEDLPELRAKSFKLMDIDPDDSLRFAFWTGEGAYVLLVSRGAQAIHFSTEEVRPSGVGSGGMRGMKLDDDRDEIVGAGLSGTGKQVWVATDEGVGKRTPCEEYPTQGRAGGGVRTLKLSPNSKGIAAALILEAGADWVALTHKGRAKKGRLNATPLAKRDAKGEGVVSLAKDERVAGALTFEPRWGALPVENPAPEPEISPTQEGLFGG